VNLWKNCYTTTVIVKIKRHPSCLNKDEVEIFQKAIPTSLEKFFLEINENIIFGSTYEASVLVERRFENELVGKWNQISTLKTGKTKTITKEGTSKLIKFK
jgi:hypothetical protein